MANVCVAKWNARFGLVLTKFWAGIFDKICTCFCSKTRLEEHPGASGCFWAIHGEGNPGLELNPLDQKRLKIKIKDIHSERLNFSAGEILWEKKHAVNSCGERFYSWEIVATKFEENDKVLLCGDLFLFKDDWIWPRWNLKLRETRLGIFWLGERFWRWMLLSDWSMT